MPHSWWVSIQHIFVYSERYWTIDINILTRETLGGILGIGLMLWLL